MSELDFSMAYVRVNDLLDKAKTQQEAYESDENVSLIEDTIISDAKRIVNAVEEYPTVVEEGPRWGDLIRGRDEVIRATERLSQSPEQIHQVVRAAEQMKTSLQRMEGRVD